MKTREIDKESNEPDLEEGSEIGADAAEKSEASWCYLFTHHSKVESVSRKIEKCFRVFVHKHISYKREGKQIEKKERQTISGLIFVQGHGDEVQAFLVKTCPGLYVVKDCSTGKKAAIPDHVMQPFMQMAQVNPTRIRFMLHPFGYYSAGNPLIRITSGILSGMEGYRIRISRDKCFITSLGGITVAIGGIHKESFENLEEYAKLRQEQKKGAAQPSETALSPLYAEIGKCFFPARGRLDFMAIAQSLAVWVAKMKGDLSSGEWEKVADVAFCLLDTIGGFFFQLPQDARNADGADLMEVAKEADRALLHVAHRAGVSEALQERVMVGRESLVVRFPYLPIEF